jgi:hypothetical protein
VNGENNKPILEGSQGIDDDSIWPRGAQKADPVQLIETAQQILDDARRDCGISQKTVETPSKDGQLRDMPDAVLQGRLGEICQKRLSRSPLAYAWPATLTVASALIPDHEPTVRTNLYTGLVGPVHSGKSQTIDHAVRILGIAPPVLMDTVAGSAEALTRETASAEGQPRLFSPDELGHPLEKLKIERSSFSFILNTAYYKSKFRVLMGKKENTDFNCWLSILGSLVEDRFSDLFNFATCGGLYDRFMFGLSPGNFQYEYRPFEGPVESFRTVPVAIHPHVWEAKSSWERMHPGSNPRILEISIRAATICASFDGKTVLKVDDLGPHFQLAKYQHRIREILKPNPGENFEARLAHKFLDYLARHGGKFVSRREMYRHTRAYDLGPSIADRALSVLQANGDVEITKVGKQVIVRLISDFEDIPIQEPQS